ncbi:hypothetical protein VNO78_18636 [Psophocarpus tetragonolobus]|uniref:Uncharacterized protein n=1 Tax=Psophocarpus tetragonolobus TaxID=3891 RepID=A0AAN9SIT7_PSOTE
MTIHLFPHFPHNSSHPSTHPPVSPSTSLNSEAIVAFETTNDAPDTRPLSLDMCENESQPLPTSTIRASVDHPLLVSHMLQHLEDKVSSERGCC